MTYLSVATDPRPAPPRPGLEVRSVKAGEAVALSSSVPSMLRVATGHVWATLDGPHGGTPDDEGDLVLGPGATLEVQPGNRLVLEAWHQAAETPARFSFEPLAESAPCAGATASRWQCAVILPGREFAAASVRALAALARLVWGLAGYAEFLVAGRGRVLGRLESNSP